MPAFLFFAIFLIEVFALANRGGGPLLSHLFLIGITFFSICYTFLFRQKLNFQLRCTKAHLSYILFLTFFGISFFTALTLEFGLSEILLFSNMGILFFLFSGLAIKEKHLRWFSTGLIAIAVIDTLLGYFIYTQTPFPRFAGTFIDLGEPYTVFGNDFANFLLLILPLALSEFVKKHERITTTLVMSLSVSVLFSGFLLSFSRAAWVSFFVVAAFTTAWIFIRRKKLIFHSRISFGEMLSRLVSVVLLVILLVNFLQWTRAKKFETTPLLKKATFTAHEGNASALERLQFWKGAIKLIRDRPFFGSGVLSFKFLYPKYQEKFGVNWNHPHNLFLKIGVENGIPAAIFLSLFLIGVGLTIIKFSWKFPQHSVFPFFLGALGSFGHNLFDFNFIVSNFTLFIVFLGLGMGVALSYGEYSKKSSSQNKKFIFPILIIFSSLLLMLGMYEGYYNIHFKKGRAALREKRFDEAIFRLEKSQNLFFKRDLIHFLHGAYLEQFKKTHEALWGKKSRDLLLSYVHTKTDAQLLGKIGEDFFQNKRFSEAEEFFTKALAIDAQNYFKFYFFLLDSQKAQRKSIQPAMLKKIQTLLKEYQIFLQQNRHFTVVTENPLYASKLYGFLGMKQEQAIFDRIWFEELVKFTVKYGAPQQAYGAS